MFQRRRGVRITVKEFLLLKIYGTFKGKGISNKWEEGGGGGAVYSEHFVTGGSGQCKPL